MIGRLETQKDIRVALGIHGSQTRSSRNRGIGRYVQELSAELLRRYPRIITELWLDPRLPLPPNLSGAFDCAILRPSSSSNGHFWRGEEINIYHIMSPMELDLSVSDIFPREIARSSARIVVTLHDLIPLIFQETHLTDLTARARYLRRLSLITEADHVIAVSRATALDAQRLLGIPPTKISVVYEGVSTTFQPPQVPPRILLRQVCHRVRGLSDPYVLYTGGDDVRKNITNLILAFALLPADLLSRYQLVVACDLPPHRKEEYESLARCNGIGNRVILTGFVPDELLVLLYQACTLFVFPSRYEGFGLPIVEAMHCGVPVVASDCSSMREIVEVPEARFDPDDPAAIMQAIKTALTRPEWLQQLREYSLHRASQFTWEKAAHETAEIYQAVAAADHRRHRSLGAQRRRLAFCTPYPPEVGEVARRSWSVIENLVSRYPVQVDVVVEGPISRYRPLSSPRIRLVEAADFLIMAHWNPYDQVIYCIGDDPACRYIHELAGRYPGCVWMPEKVARCLAITAPDSPNRPASPGSRSRLHNLDSHTHECTICISFPTRVTHAELFSHPGRKQEATSLSLGGADNINGIIDTIWRLATGQSRAAISR